MCLITGMLLLFNERLLSRMLCKAFYLTVIFSIVSGSYASTNAAKIIQENCRECHGTDGKAKVESWPNLNCQNRGYLYSRLIKLKRSSDHDIDEKAKKLSITEVDEISRYYSELKCTNRH